MFVFLQVVSNKTPLKIVEDRFCKSESSVHDSHQQVAAPVEAKKARVCHRRKTSNLKNPKFLILTSKKIGKNRMRQKMKLQCK